LPNRSPVACRRALMATWLTGPPVSGPAPPAHPRSQSRLSSPKRAPRLVTGSRKRHTGWRCLPASSCISIMCRIGPMPWMTAHTSATGLHTRYIRLQVACQTCWTGDGDGLLAEQQGLGIKCQVQGQGRGHFSLQRHIRAPHDRSLLPTRGLRATGRVHRRTCVTTRPVCSRNWLSTCT